MNPAQVQIKPSRPGDGPAEVVVTSADGAQSATLHCADWAAAMAVRNAIAYYALGLEVQEPGL